MAHADWMFGIGCGVAGLVVIMLWQIESRLTEAVSLLREISANTDRIEFSN